MCGIKYRPPPLSSPSLMKQTSLKHNLSVEFHGAGSSRDLDFFISFCKAERSLGVDQFVCVYTRTHIRTHPHKSLKVLMQVQDASWKSWIAPPPRTSDWYYRERWRK